MTWCVVMRLVRPKHVGIRGIWIGQRIFRRFSDHGSILFKSVWKGLEFWFFERSLFCIVSLSICSPCPSTSQVSH